VYAKVFSPLVSSYEADIDKLYMDGRTKVRKLSYMLHLFHWCYNITCHLCLFCKCWYAKVFSPLVSSYEADIDKLYMDGRTKVRKLSFLLH
jgi:hypothetical protein